ncbi:MAG: hypothetical protein KF729_37905, partial [Sandaracinaceae bacterium]|nr:hypothetical protein [Sandaracinaceae bacterium]
PRPPLVSDARAALSAHGLAPDPRAPREVTLALTDAAQRAASRALHRLRVLRVPGFTRLSGPARATDPVLEETWEIAAALDAEAALVEASALGPTLAAAAAGALEERLSAADLEALAAVLAEALFVGVDALTERAIARAAALAAREPRLDRLGRALGPLIAIWRHDHTLGGASAPALARVIEASVARALWLLEGRAGRATSADELHAVLAIRDAARLDGLDVDAEIVREVMTRRAADPHAPPALRGAALGYLWAEGALEPAVAERRALDALARTSRAEALGALLGGLFALAREATAESPGLLRAIDAHLAERPWDDFLAALPALRAAFGWFPPRERDAIARRVLALHGAADDEPERLRRLALAPSSLSRADALERHLDALEARYGLTP